MTLGNMFKHVFELRLSFLSDVGSVTLQQRPEHCQLVRVEREKLRIKKAS